MSKINWRNETITVDGKLREFQWTGPSTVDEPYKISEAMVIAFHGSSSSGDSMRGLGLESWVNQHGAWLVVPNGIGGGWNDERPRRAASTGYADDRGFAMALKEWIVRRFPIRKDRVFAVGFSNGAMLCQSLAARVPEHFSGFASVCGAIPVAVSETTQSVQPVSQYLFLGKQDTVIGNDFSDRYQWGEIKTAHQTVDWWKELWIEAGLVVEDRDFKELEAIRGGSPLEENIIRFNTGHEICLATWKPGGHFWPGDEDGQWKGHDGNKCNLSDRIWLFFEKQMDN